MKQEKSLSDNFYILETLLLSGLLVLVLSNKLQAEPKPEISPEQPYAYLFEGKYKKLTEDIELDVELHRIDRILRDKKQALEERSFRLQTEHRQETKRFKAGTILVKTDQKLSDKIKELLDPTTKKKAVIRKLIRRLKAAIIRLSYYIRTCRSRTGPYAL